MTDPAPGKVTAADRHRSAEGTRKRRRMGEAAPEEVTHQESSPTRVSQRRGRRVSPPQQTLEVRAATSSDLDAIVLLRMALLHEEAKSNLVARLRPDAPQRARALFAAELASERGITLLASIAGQAIGVVRCSTSRSAELVSPSRYAYLSWAWVRPEYRRQGVLRALVAAAEQWSRERGLSEMRLRVTMDNAVGDAAWSALGFAPVELVRRRPIPSD